VAVSRADLGGEGIRVVLAYEGAGLIGCVVLTPAHDASTTLHAVVDPAVRRTDALGVWSTLLKSALAEAGGITRLWVMRVTPERDGELAPFGFVPDRDLLQMRVSLPLPPEVTDGVVPVVTRPFQPGRDDEAWVAVNNRAFAGHQEQGAWTVEELHQRLQLPWFDADGFRVATDDAGDIIGSCWTKVHPDAGPLIGEIYVISVDPGHHGQGLGRALTVAGLEWLAGRGITDGMLYTDASNTAAVGLYDSLGFTVDHVDRCYIHRP
jgi:mycothiol synthase